jgi:hypothetical protein
MKTLIEDGYCRSQKRKKTGAASAKWQKLPYGTSLLDVKLLVCIVTASPSGLPVSLKSLLIIGSSSTCRKVCIFLALPMCVCFLFFDHLFCFLIQ